MDNYDVIIVGAGIGGLKLAELLNDSSLRVLLIEKRNTIKELVTDYFVTFEDEMIEAGVQDFIVQRCGWGFYAKDKHVYRDLKDKYSVCAVKMNPWAATRELKCEVKVNTEITNLKRNKEGIILFDKKGNNYFAKIIVDCSGLAQVISGLLGIKKSNCDFLNHYYILENHKMKNKREMFYYQDMNLTNCGGWFHALDGNKCIFGCAEFTVKGHLPEEEIKKRLDCYRETFYPFYEYLEGAEIIESDCLAGPTTTAHSSIVEDNYLSVGNASGCGTPFTGLGLYTALKMAKYAHIAIVKAFKVNDFSKKTLKIHKKLFHAEYGRWYKTARLLRFLYLRYVTNYELDLIAERLKKFSDEDYFSFITSRVTFDMIVRKLLGMKVIALIIKNAFIYHFLQPLSLAKVQKRPQEI